MNVVISAVVVSPHEKVFAEVEREIEMPVPPHAGMLLHGLDPKHEEYSLRVHVVVWDAKAQKLYADVGEFFGTTTLTDELALWAKAGWNAVSTDQLPEGHGLDDYEHKAGGHCDEVGLDDGDEDDPDGQRAGDINIYDSVVHVYNGNSAVNHETE